MPRRVFCCHIDIFIYDYGTEFVRATLPSILKTTKMGRYL